ncbi:cyanase [Alginatibacterium sediminis]|uniref:Cyanate hydratase n=1 Tax=Alginatibacterium sediminis TaxID=2164068 RepID=A0A420EI21_9ALTE|nr:cyanase [Alginatibacterium sediminis]RKF20310.1 cyanase [Alginatibacterium sediminis]
MTINEISQKLLDAKYRSKLSFAQIGEAIGRDEIWIAALCYGQASANETEAKHVLGVLGLSLDLFPSLCQSQSKGLGPSVPTDPLIYRFYEIMQVYGYPMKAIIHEKFGDGIMSAIDFTMAIDKVEDPKGDRVKVTFDGKFLPYKKW